MPARDPFHRLPSRPLLPQCLSVLALLASAAASYAQTEPAPAESAPAPAKEAAKLAPVEITGARANDMQERRQSTAAKIVIGREEIDRFGDSTVGEVLKRLPGITLQGAPGRGGAIRMRGLGNGYTQILLDGERVPPGFSIDSLTPEQIERIEILRAPTAETGARAIAGTINIVTREGFSKRLNNLRLGAAFENGRVRPGFSWTRNDTVDDMIYNISLSAFQADRLSESVTTTVHEDFSPTGVDTVKREAAESRDNSRGLHATGRLQWKGERGTSLVLMPIVSYSETDTARTTRLTQDGGGAPYDRSEGSVTGHYTLARLNGQWNRLTEGAGRVEVKGGLGQGRWDGRSTRTLIRDDGTPLPLGYSNLDDTNSSRDTHGTLGAKYTTLLPNDHSFVAGAELENNRRSERHSESDDAGDDFSASSLRTAAYAQDEWNVNPQWAVHAGLRWEGIHTRSDALDTGGGTLVDVFNRSSVWTPLFHTVWKPDPKSRDQVRLSLTRSYRSPSLQTLIARPRESADNSATRPDRVGNPNLKPELATGIDVAIERYLVGSGILSANVFSRQISNYMRSVTSLDAATGRYVSRTENVGDAVTQGIELEAKFRLSDVVDGAPPVDFRTNGSVFQSRVKPVPGPDNRLDQQPGGTANVGADYRFRSMPITLGGNVNWTPGYTTRISETQWIVQGRKLVGDAYVLYTINPTAQVRVTASNFAPRDYLTGSNYEGASSRETSETDAASYVNWQLRLELKL